jgi:hypothetical protein
VVPASASPSPITVNLRVEGSTRTLIEGPVTSDAIPNPPGISTPSSKGAHPCDVKDNGSNGGFGVAAATATTALYDAAVARGLSFDAKWEEKGLNDFFITQVGPDVNGGEPEYPSWGYAVNYTTAGVGGCQFQLAPGSEVLWAYNYFNLPHLLGLTAPAAVNAGAPFAVHVVDSQTGQPIAGASIGEFVQGVTTPIPSVQLTDASGNTIVSLTHAGAVALKATRVESVRSNAVAVCVHVNNDGTCGTSNSSGQASTNSSAAMNPSPTPEVARIVGIKSGHIYRRRSAPRLLRGTVRVGSNNTLREVRIRLERRYRGRCSGFSGSREMFVRLARCGDAAFFSVGDSESFSYLLPAPLRSGRYTFDIEAVDGHGRATTLIGGVSHIVFRVR